MARTLAANPANGPVVGLLCLLALYTLVFALAKPDWQGAVEALLRNALPLVVVWSLSIVAARRISRSLRGWRAIGAHAAAAVLASLVLLVLVTASFGVAETMSLQSFDVRPAFAGGAYVWQISGGMQIYALAALVAYVADIAARNETGGAIATDNPAYPDRFFVKGEDDARPLATSEIIVLRAEGDFTRITTGSREILARGRLAEWQASLDPARFCRVHRSTILALDRIDSFEPDGTGRLCVRMADGSLVRTSREGAKALRAYVL